MPVAAPAVPPFASPRLVLPVSGDSTNGAPPSPSPRSNVEGGLLAAQSAATSSPSLGARSPVMDAVDLTFGPEGSAAPSTRSEGQPGMVKIGQTTLHNPGGRSSWYGL